MSKQRVRHHVNPLADQTEVSFAGFGNTKPIIIDVGADRGEFTEGLLEKCKDTRNFIVFEIRKPLAERLREKFAKHKNIVVFDGDAARNFRSVLGSCIAQGAAIDTIYINFPDPWFKDRHKKRRFLTAALVKDVRTWLSPQTQWIFQTDQKQLFEETVAMLRENGIGEINFFDTPPEDVSTKWEEAKSVAGATIYRMRFSL